MERLDIRTVLFLLLLGVGCQPADRPASRLPAESEAVDPDKVTSFQAWDSIPVKGKRVDPTAVAPPRVAPLKAPPVSFPAHPDITPAGEPVVVAGEGVPRSVTPGRNGVPMPKTITVQQTRVIPQRSAPIAARPPEMEATAAWDIRSLGVEQGLAGSTVYAVWQDSRQWFWFGTSTGLSCFDGSWFRNYTAQQGLAGNIIPSVFEDSRQNLWFGTYEGLLIKYDGEVFTHFDFGEDFDLKSIYAITEDREGNIWLGLAYEGLLRYDGREFVQFTPEEGLPGTKGTVLSLTIDQRDRLWIGTEDGGVSYFDGYSFFDYPLAASGEEFPIQSIVEDRAGNIWFGTFGGGVIQFDGGQFYRYTTEQGLRSDAIQTMLVDQVGNIWMGTNDQGVIRYDGRRFTHIGEREGLKHPQVFDMREDQSGKIWFATGGGVSFLDPGSFQFPTAYAEHIQSEIYTAVVDPRGDLWFGTLDKGIFKYDGRDFSHYTVDQGFPANALHVQCADREGNIWISVEGDGGGGVVRFTPDQAGRPGIITHFTTRHGLPSDFVKTILQDRAGNIWIGTSNGGAARFDGEAFTHFGIKEGLKSNDVWALYEDSQGNIWFGTYRGGASRYSGTHLTNLSQGDGLASDDISYILEDGQHNLWFGTAADGLSVFDGQRFNHYTVADGLSSNNIYDIEEDLQGNIWIGTQAGITIALLEGEDRMPVPGQDAPVREFFTLGKAEGLKNITINRLLLDQRNQIWAASCPNGLSRLDRNRFQLPIRPPAVELAAVDIAQTPLDFRYLLQGNYPDSVSLFADIRQGIASVEPFRNLPQKMRLPHDLNHLSFSFSSPDWMNEPDLRFSYFLEGLEETWSAPQVEHRVEYRALPPGKYTFNLRAMGAANEWGPKTTYTFQISPPFWLSLPAKVLYFLLGLILIYFLFQYLLRRRLQLVEARRIRELDELKNQFFTNITHEFRTPLTIILGMVDQIEDDSRSSLQTGLGLIRRNARDLLGLVNQMLELRKLDVGHQEVKWAQVNVVAFLKYLSESYAAYAERKSIRFTTQFAHEELFMDTDSEKLQHIVANLLSNAVKFTPKGGKVVFALNTDGEELLLSVSDTGAGIEEAQRMKIFDRFYQAGDHASGQGDGMGIGLALTRGLVHLLGGTISVESTLGQGSSFEVRLPIHREAPLQPLRQPSAMDAEVKVQSVEEKAAGADGALEEKPLLLLIEDNEDVLYYLHSALGNKYKVLEAENGEEGLAIALRQIPDLIISDIRMPGKTGLEVCRILKDDFRTSHIPIILLTAKDDQQSKLSGLSSGADAYLLKPFQREELLIRIRQLLRLRNQLRKRYQGMAAGHQPEPVSAGSKPKESAFVKKFRQLITDQLADENLQVSDLAEQMEMSSTQLYRKMKALTGHSPSEFLRMLRLDKARDLLASSDMSIAEVSFACGFSDPSYFSRLFKKELGVTPTAYKEGEVAG